MYNIVMNRCPYQGLQDARAELQLAEAELEKLEQQIQSFEALVDSRLGDKLDRLSALNAEITSLSESLLLIREQRLYGKDRIKYLGAAPPPARIPKLYDPPSVWESLHQAARGEEEAPSPSPAAESGSLNIKELYRKLARRYHPDLAQSVAERLQLNEEMVEINQAYAVGDMAALMTLAGMRVPFGMELNQQNARGARPDSPQSELEIIRTKLKQVHQQIARLSKLPSVQLSLQVKLAAHQGRDMLAEITSELERKVQRKIAERDYLKAQIQASGAIEDG